MKDIKVSLLLSGAVAMAAAFGFGDELSSPSPSPLSRLEFDSVSMKIDGERKFLISGEFHYFRVPKHDWRRRLELLKGAGGNCVATYVPWCLHEATEGDIRFGDSPERDLAAFLTLVKEMGLMAIVRPGPYQYSELVYDGLPRWLFEKYPEVRMRKPDGSLVGSSSIDYNHPVFLAKVRAYFKAVAQVLRPFMAENSGPIAIVQLDNELTGIHVWRGYPGSEAYFKDCAKYLVTLRDYLKEDGIAGPYCHNAGGALMAAYYEPCVRALGNRDFILGYDHYYGLFQGAQESPTPYYFESALFACDMMRAFGFPPVGFEIQSGTIGEVPPMLKEEMLACYMLNLAAGLRGINYYVFTGGPNPKDMGNTCDVYDYHAPIAADGTVRPTYAALKSFGEFVSSHPQLLDASRVTAVRMGAQWQHFAEIGGMDLNFYRSGIFHVLMQSPYHPENYLLGGEIPLDGRPLVLAGLGKMSADVQRQVADYVLNGGGLLVVPDFPRVDLDGNPCTILADAVAAGKIEPSRHDIAAQPVIMINGSRQYGLTPQFERGKGVFAAAWRCGEGRVSWLGCTWRQHSFAQAEMAGDLVAALGARPVVSSSNRNVLTTAYRLKSGKLGVFVLNLRPAPQSTTLQSGESREALTIPPMKVEYLEM